MVVVVLLLPPEPPKAPDVEVSPGSFASVVAPLHAAVSQSVRAESQSEGVESFSSAGNPLMLRQFEDGSKVIRVQSSPTVLHARGVFRCVKL